MDQERLRQLSDQATVRLLNKPGTASSNRGGWMMIATILIEAWDLYAISFVLVFMINLVLTALYLQIVPPKGI